MHRQIVFNIPISIELNKFPRKTQSSSIFKIAFDILKIDCFSLNDFNENQAAQYACTILI